VEGPQQLGAMMSSAGLSPAVLPVAGPAPLAAVAAPA
jgi:hypothetical protein